MNGVFAQSVGLYVIASRVMQMNASNPYDYLTEAGINTQDG